MKKTREKDIITKIRKIIPPLQGREQITWGKLPPSKNVKPVRFDNLPAKTDWEKGIYLGVGEDAPFGDIEKGKQYSEFFLCCSPYTGRMYVQGRLPIPVKFYPLMISRKALEEKLKFLLGGKWVPVK